MKLKPSYLLLVAFFVVISLSLSTSSSLADAKPLAALPKPANIACQGYERDTVVIYWKDTATDETEYRIERSIDGAAFTEIDTKTPDASGYYGGYFDKGIDTSKNYRYRIRSYRSSDTSYSPYSDICNNRRIYEPNNFRLFYGVLNTTDDCPKIGTQEACLTNKTSGGVNVYAKQVYDVIQGAAGAFDRLGYTREADQPVGSLDKIPVNAIWSDGGGSAYNDGLNLAPGIIETSFNLTTRAGDPAAYIVPLHEMYHYQQFRYSGLNDPYQNWVIEGQARSIQDKICIGATRATALCFDDIATGYCGYVPEVKSYLGNPNRTINKISYSAALFWTFLTEKYGTENMSDKAEMGLDFLRRFWEEASTNTGQTGIEVINAVLTSLGRTEQFRDIWKDFAVANYAKDYTGKSKYQYVDVSQTGGSYGAPYLTLDKDLSPDESWLDTDETVYSWAAKYYEVHPESGVSYITIKINQDTSNKLYYTVLGIQGTAITYEFNSEERDLDLSLMNNSYDKVAIIVAGLEDMCNYRISINGTQPSLRILSPIESNPAKVGSQSSPGKFLVQVEVLDAEGVPMTGVNMSNFTFQIGSVVVGTSRIINKYQVMGQEWFVIHAPPQTDDDGDGTPYTYDLEVSYNTTLTDTENDAVDYTDRENADSVIVLDRSGSMNWYDKLTNAAKAAHLFIDSWQTNDSIGIVSFNESTTVDMHLTAWSDSPSGGSRKTAFDTIDALTAGGGTRIGDSLVKGYDELVASGNKDNDWALVLFSDGVETDPGTRSFDAAINYIAALTGKKPVIHSVAIGPDADRPRMQRAASATGGTYQYVSSPAKVVTLDGVKDISSMLLSMDYRYRMIATKVVGYQQFFTTVGPTNPDQDDISIPVEPGADEMVLSLSWDGLMGDIGLYDPESGQTYTPVEQDDNHWIWRIGNPIPGTWHLIVNEFIIPNSSQADTNLPNDLPSYLVQASLKSDVLMDAQITTPVEGRVPGSRIQFIASLTDNAPITGATVQAAIESPSGGMYYRSMWDDGLHDDSEANDGVYGGSFYQTGEQGSYNITILASGYSSLLGSNFVRSTVLSFHMAFVDENGNEIFYGDDGDGLPDAWEVFWFGDPAFAGPMDDPDNDRSPNQDEFMRGTNPLDPDSDDDGNADSTDPNPSDPDPNSIILPEVQAYAGIGQVFVKYSIDPSYQLLELFRNDPFNPPFVFVHQAVPPFDGVFTDTVVSNDVQYCYILAAVNDLGQRSTYTAPTCATPKADPLAPHGAVVINGGASTTASPDVTLTLWASDDVDPETDYPGSNPFLPPADSASGVTEMLISNLPDFSDAAWEPYDTSKPWTLAQPSGLAAVYVKYRDAAGNESNIYVATIYIGTGPIYQSFFLPYVNK